MPTAPHSRSDLDLTKVDWRQVDATSDEAIAQQAAEDADTAPVFTAEEILAAGRRIAIALRHTVASQLVGDDHPRLVLQSLEQPFEEALGGFRIAPFLNEDVQRNTMLVNSSPEIMLHALDPNEDLVQVPFVARVGSAAAQSVGKAPAEFPAPAPYCLVGDGNASFCQYQLDVT